VAPTTAGDTAFTRTAASSTDSVGTCASTAPVDHRQGRRARRRGGFVALVLPLTTSMPSEPQTTALRG
jgi:hypothetical protein